MTSFNGLQLTKVIMLPTQLSTFDNLKKV